MCKIMVLTGIENSALALDFMKAVSSEMSIFNTDGIGYSAINSRNQLFTERWHNNRQFLDTETVFDEATSIAMKEALSPFSGRLPSGFNLPINYQSIGEVTRDDLRTVTMHTRFATCGKTFENVHPFVDNGISLIHNGVINNANILNLNKISTCDSENALQLYNNMNLNLQDETEAYQEFVDKLRGYWAFAFLAKNPEGEYMLDIVREGAKLYWAKLPELGNDCIVFATDYRTIDVGVETLGLPVRKKTFLLAESNYHRFNAVSGEFISNHIVDESVLNASTWTYKKNYSRNTYPKKSNETEVYTPVEDKPVISQSETYEGYTAKKTELSENKKLNEAMQGLSDEINFNDFYNTDEPLIDRLYAYDKLMNTAYGDSYEDLPEVTRLFIEKKEDEIYIIFDDVLKMIEKFQETDEISSIFTVYREKKKA